MMADSSRSTPGSKRSARIGRIIEQVAAQRLAGDELADEVVLAAHPDLAPELGEELGELRMVLQARYRVIGSSDAASTIRVRPEDRPGRVVLGGGSASIRGYDILREIHRGGQGVVYQAYQRSTKRNVAIKVLLEGPFASELARKRFEREIELVAQLKHPHIISVFDSGLTSDGQQYCVMDFVRGVPLNDYVRSADLSLEKTLDLFVAVCDAVQYAHQRGIIHRDLKPSNILVNGDASPRVLDFGLAKIAADHSDPAATVLSMKGQLIGTLAYMSPEQARGDPEQVDLRTDVYALGVVLYEMLTGRHPYPVTGPMGDVLRHIVEAEPIPPSRSWRFHCGVKQRSGKRVRRSQCPIDDEVSTILLKALAKAPARRYQSVGELSQDIGRYLAGQPIDAKRDSGWYVLKKTLRRHRIPVSIAGAFVTLILASAIGLGVLYREATRQAGLATREAHKAQDIQSLMTKILASPNPYKGGRDITMGQVLDRAVQDLDFPDGATEQEVQAVARSVIGGSYLGLGDYKNAETQINLAIEWQRELGENARIDLADSLDRMARLTFEVRSDISGAEQLYLDAAALRGDDDSDRSESVALRWNRLGELNAASGKLELASQLFQRSYSLWYALDPDHPSLVDSLNNRAFVLVELGEYPTAEALDRLVVRADREQVGDDHPNLATSLNNLGLALLHQGHFVQAEPLIGEALDIRRRQFPDPHSAIANSLVAQAYLEFVRGDLPASEQRYRKALAMQQEVFGDRHLAIAFTAVSLAAVMAQSGETAQAEDLLQQSKDQYEALTGAISMNVPWFYYYNRAVLAHRRGDLTLAEQLGLSALEMFRELGGEKSAHAALALNRLGLIAGDAGDLERAGALCRESLDLRRDVLGEDHASIASGLIDWAGVLMLDSQWDRAETLLRQAIDLRTSLVPPLAWLVADARAHLGRCLTTGGKFNDAESLLIEGQQMLSDQLGDADPRTIAVGEWLVGLYESWNGPEQAEPYRRGKHVRE